jgi:predicted MFS family arabinose efflux permease
MGSLAVLRNPNYRRFAVANLISGIGDWFHSVAVFALLWELTGSGMSIGITIAMRTFPYLLFGPLGGWLADRLNRKRIMIFCDGARAVLALLFLVASVQKEVWLVYVGTFSLVAFSALYNPARIAIIPQLVDKEQVASANAVDQSIAGSVIAAGSMIGGIFTALLGVEAAFWFNSLSYLFSGLLLLGMAVRPVSDVEQAEKGSSSSYRELLPLFRRKPAIPLILSLALFWPIGGGVINVLLSVYALDVFHAGEAGVGMMYGAIGAGFLIGGFLVDTLKRWANLTAAFGLALEGMAHLFASLAPNLYTAALLLTFATMAAGVSEAELRTLMMRFVPSDLQGRVFALEGTMSSTVLGLSSLAAGGLLDSVPPRQLGFVSGLLIAVTSCAIGILLWRQLRHHEKRVAA